MKDEKKENNNAISDYIKERNNNWHKYLEDHIEDFVNANDVFDYVIDQILENEQITDIDSKKRHLRKKYTKLLKDILHRDIEEFKYKNKANLIPKNDFYIVATLLEFAALNTRERHDYVSQWFNGKLDLNDPRKTNVLCQELINHIRIMNSCSWIDDVTKDEWINTFSTIFHYNTSQMLIDIIDKLKFLNNTTIAVNHDICNDSITVHIGSARKYVFKPKTLGAFETKMDIHDKTIDEILKNIICQKDYFYVIDEFVKILEKKAEKEAIESIKKLVELKKVFGFINIKESLETNEKYSLASEYRAWYQSIYEFLKIKPDICRQIEKETETDNLLEYFNMDA